MAANPNISVFNPGGSGGATAAAGHAPARAGPRVQLRKPLMEALGSSTREAEKVADEMLDEILTVHPDEKSKEVRMKIRAVQTALKGSKAGPIRACLLAGTLSAKDAVQLDAKALEAAANAASARAAEASLGAAAAEGSEDAGAALDEHVLGPSVELRRQTSAERPPSPASHVPPSPSTHVAEARPLPRSPLGVFNAITSKDSAALESPMDLLRRTSGACKQETPPAAPPSPLPPMQEDPRVIAPPSPPAIVEELPPSQLPPPASVQGPPPPPAVHAEGPPPASSAPVPPSPPSPVQEAQEHPLESARAATEATPPTASSPSHASNSGSPSRKVRPPVMETVKPVQPATQTHAAPPAAAEPAPMHATDAGPTNTSALRTRSPDIDDCSPELTERLQQIRNARYRARSQREQFAQMAKMTSARSVPANVLSARVEMEPSKENGAKPPMDEVKIANGNKWEIEQVQEEASRLRKQLEEEQQTKKTLEEKLQKAEKATIEMLQKADVPPMPIPILEEDKSRLEAEVHTLRLQLQEEREGSSRQLQDLQAQLDSKAASTPKAGSESVLREEIQDLMEELDRLKESSSLVSRERDSLKKSCAEMQQEKAALEKVAQTQRRALEEVGMGEGMSAAETAVVVTEAAEEVERLQIELKSAFAIISRERIASEKREQEMMRAHQEELMAYMHRQETLRSLLESVQLELAITQQERSDKITSLLERSEALVSEGQAPQDIQQNAVARTQELHNGAAGGKVAGEEHAPTTWAAMPPPQVPDNIFGSPADGATLGRTAEEHAPDLWEQMQDGTQPPSIAATQWFTLADPDESGFVEEAEDTKPLREEIDNAERSTAAASLATDHSAPNGASADVAWAPAAVPDAFAATVDRAAEALPPVPDSIFAALETASDKDNFFSELAGVARAAEALPQVPGAHCVHESAPVPDDIFAALDPEADEVWGFRAEPFGAEADLSAAMGATVQELSPVPDSIFAVLDPEGAKAAHEGFIPAQHTESSAIFATGEGVCPEFSVEADLSAAFGAVAEERVQKPIPDDIFAALDTVDDKATASDAFFGAASEGDITDVAAAFSLAANLDGDIANAFLDSGVAADVEGDVANLFGSASGVEGGGTDTFLAAPVSNTSSGYFRPTEVSDLF